MDFEIERVIKRREQQSRSEAKARWVEQIDRQIESGAFERALELLKNASAEYPDDAELGSLGELARQNQNRAAEAQQLFQQGQDLSAQRQFVEAIEVLRRAYALDENNHVVRTFLLETMLDQARAVIDTDWRAAEALSQQALDLDPSRACAAHLEIARVDFKLFRRCFHHDGAGFARRHHHRIADAMRSARRERSHAVRSGVESAVST